MQVGSGLLRSIPSLTPGTSVVSHLDLVKPYGCHWDYALMVARLAFGQGTTVFELKNMKGGLGMYLNHLVLDCVY